MKTNGKEVTLVGTFTAFNVNEDDKATADLQLENGKTVSVYLAVDRCIETNFSLSGAWFTVKNKVKVTVRGWQREDLPDTIFNGVIIERELPRKK